MTQHSPQQISDAYAHCLAITRAHYENFPVASFLLPEHLQKPVSVIYAFARTADDYADEGSLPDSTRLAKLNALSEQLMYLNSPQLKNPIFIALKDVLDNFDLPLQLFHDLLTAFKQDVTKKRYKNYEELLEYCRYSANPVGRLLLHLIGEATPENLEQSDAICSALQLINFLQDISQDYNENGRIYLPKDEMKKYSVKEDHIKQAKTDEDFRALIHQQVTRTRELLLSGAGLGKSLSGRFGFQLRIMINSGLRILRHLEKQKDNCFSRPRLKKIDWVQSVTYAALKKHTS